LRSKRHEQGILSAAPAAGLRLGAFSGKVESGFPSENATTKDARVVFVSMEQKPL
jgi:hypothetical protein